MNKLNILSIAISIILVTISACKKEEGEGGTSTITGKVYTRHIQQYGSNAAFYDWEGYVPEQRVYIIYGTDHSTFDDDTRTSYDGSFSFKYLQEGTYKIYVLSIDTTGMSDFTFNHNKPQLPVFATVEISGKNQEKEVPQIDIFTFDRN
jgi:hypothetical protein